MQNIKGRQESGQLVRFPAAAQLRAANPKQESFEEF